MQNIDLQGVGTAFGFTVPPRVDLPLGTKGDKTTRGGKRPRGEDGEVNHHAQSGHAFSADNPYGKRQAGDTRQFSR